MTDVLRQAAELLLQLLLSPFNQGFWEFILKFIPYVVFFELPIYLLIFVGIVRYVLRLVRATRVSDDSAPELVRQRVAWGAGPRAGQFMILGAKARAALLGSYMVRLEDIEDVAAPVLTHRVITTFAAQAEGISAKEIVGRLVKETEVEA